MKTIYKIKPILQETVWGGETIGNYYGLETGHKKIGQIYHVIALPGHLDNVVEDTNETLSEFFKSHHQLFDCSGDVFPIRMATACNAGKMSYHLHPNNEYAKAHENSLGKVSGSIPYEPKGEERIAMSGNNARSLEEFKKMVEEKDWAHLFKTVKIRDNQFYHTPAGVIHGGAGNSTMAIVFATNSDISYRFYDYDRNDPNRKLSLNEVYDCVNIPEVNFKPLDVKSKIENNLEISTYYDKEKEYIAKKIMCQDEGTIIITHFAFLLVAKGSGVIGDVEVKTGMTVFAPAEYGNLPIRGKMKIYMISYRDC